MFTGLIQGLGTIEWRGDDQLQVSCHPGHLDAILLDLSWGDSVAVDGVCLTVTEILSQGFLAVASPETLRRSTLGKIHQAVVNLETSLRAGSKLGGHFVTGHVDSLGCLESVAKTASAWEIQFVPPIDGSYWHQQIAPYLVPKGSIAVNGISLTVADCHPAGNWFSVAVIPHTFYQTNLQDLEPGSLVNLEADILGKYVGKFMQIYQQGHLENGRLKEEITPEFLAENGY